MSAYNEASGINPESSTADVIIQQTSPSIKLLDKLPEGIVEQFEDRLFPCNINRDENGKKQVRLPKDWTDADKEFDDFNSADANSIAIRTGKGIVVIDMDTKDVKALETNMQILAEKWLKDKATFIIETTNGYHFYFDSASTIYSNSVRISDFVDIRGDGGCAFCYTEDENSSYRVLSSEEPLPLTQEILEYISLQERSFKTVEYKYDDSNKRIATISHKHNDLMAKAVAEKNKPKLFESCGFQASDFQNTDGLYNRLNSFAFILAMNPAFPNDKVLSMIRAIVKEYSGFDPDSSESTKRLKQIFSTLIYADEDDVIEVAEEDIFVEDETENEVIAEAIVPFDGSNLVFPQELKQCRFLFDWLMQSDTKTHSVAALTALITVASAVTARGYYTHTRASTSLYTILISSTGSGKNLVVKAPEKIMKLLGQGDKIIASKISSEGAMDDIFKMQTIAIHVIDEFGDQLGQMLNDKGGYLKSVATKIKNLYSLTNGSYSPGKYSSAGGKNKTSKAWSLERPCYGLTGMTTKVQLLSHLNESMLHDGLLNRFIILNGQNVKPQFNEHPSYDVPSEIIGYIKSIKMSTLCRIPEDEEAYLVDNSDLSYFAEDEYKIIGLSADALDYYHKFIGDPDIEDTDIHSFCQNDETEVKRALSIRWRENALRLATALTAYEKLEVVSLEVLKWCYHLVKGSSIGFFSMFEKEAAGTKHEQQRMKAMQWFRNQDQDKWFTLSYLGRSARPFSSLKSKERRELLDDLVEAKILDCKVNTIANTVEHLYKIRTN